MTKLIQPEFTGSYLKAVELKTNRIESIDLLRGIVMIIMALDHVRSYFHYDAFQFTPTDISRTNAPLFFTRFITHYCAPVFVFLAGISASIFGITKSKRKLSSYLFNRGIWLILVEIYIISLAWTFNPTYPIFSLQVIWAIGVSMIVLSVMVYMERVYVLLTAILFIGFHNLLDSIHVPGTGMASFFWSFLHEPGEFIFSYSKFRVRYPVIPWIGIMVLGYYFGKLYDHGYNPVKRRKILLMSGVVFIGLFVALRSFNIYGDGARWSVQKNSLFTLLSFLNVTKYPPSLLYVLITLGPALIFLSLCEKPLKSIAKKIALFGRVPFFYYVIHLFAIHLLAVIGAVVLGYDMSSMILMDSVNRVAELKGYGFSLWTVYLVWILLVLSLYPCCRWFDRYKRKYRLEKHWLSYL